MNDADLKPERVAVSAGDAPHHSVDAAARESLRRLDDLEAELERRLADFLGRHARPDVRPAADG
jgi:hypothetical protein